MTRALSNLRALNDGLRWQPGFKIPDNGRMVMQRVVQKAPLHTVGGRVSGDLQFWLSQPVAARLAAVELLRQQMWGPDAERPIQRVCRVTGLNSNQLEPVEHLESCRGLPAGFTSSLRAR